MKSITFSGALLRLEAVRLKFLKRGFRNWETAGREGNIFAILQ